MHGKEIMLLLLLAYLLAMHDFGYITVASYMDFVTSTVCSDPTSTSVAIMYSSKTLNNKLVLAIYFICMVDS